MNAYRYSKNSLILIVFLLLSLVANITAQEKASGIDGQHLGTWKLVSTKYGSATEFTKRPEANQRLKLITATHFTWVEIDQSSRKVVGSAGGTFKLTGSTYTETINFAGEGMETYLGQAQKFTIKIE